MRVMTLGFGAALVAGSAGLAEAAVGRTWDSTTLPLVTSTGLLGVGAAGLALAGPAPFDRRSTRVGLSILANGLLIIMACFASMPSPLPRGEELLEESGLMVVLLGVLVASLGLLATGLSFALGASTDGPSRAVGLGLLGGGIVGGISVASSPTLGIELIALGFAGVGLRALVVGSHGPAPRAEGV
jgi:hypothetical protein